MAGSEATSGYVRRSRRETEIQGSERIQAVPARIFYPPTISDRGISLPSREAADDDAATGDKVPAGPFFRSEEIPGGERVRRYPRWHFVNKAAVDHPADRLRRNRNRARRGLA
ncbi:hypothetical protein KM043_002739 [Ampulex compressa]|nr:hypothetical protein KM043_002739 [Ampulex compressa]